MTKAEIHPGRCAHVSEIRVQMQKTGLCDVELVSECPQMQMLASRITSVNPEDEISRGSSRIISQARRCCHHTYCPVPAALVRAVQIEFGKDLLGDINIHFNRV